MERRPAVGLPLVAYVIVMAVVAACVSLEPAATALPSGAVVADASSAAGPSAGPQRTRKPRRTPAAATTAPTLPTDTPAPTAPPTEPPTQPPTATVDPNATPFCCLTFRLPPIDIFPSGLVFEPIDPTTLDYTATPNYGTASLAAGFAPDPYSVAMISGGSVDVSYLGSSCAGFATSAPDFRITLSGTAALLRLYFVASSGDSTLVINDPFGNFYCVDDSFGTVNPTIDFNNPAGGTYDVWVASYASGTFISGTFYVTQNSGNHP